MTDKVTESSDRIHNMKLLLYNLDNVKKKN